MRNTECAFFATTFCDLIVNEKTIVDWLIIILMSGYIDRASCDAEGNKAVAILSHITVSSVQVNIC